MTDSEHTGGHAGIESAVGMGHSAVWLLLVALLWGLYLAGALRAGSAKRWPWWRTGLFSLGCLALMAGFSPSLMHWAHSDVRGHMVQHLLLGMFAPLGLVLAAPVTLLLRTLPVRGARRVVRFLAMRPVRWLTHPITAATLDMGGMYLLYMTPLYAQSLASPWLSHLLHLHFVLAGTLFTWAIAGPDPAPRRPGFRLRLATLVAAMAAHSALGKLLYARGYPRGTGASLAELETGALWMYYWGDLATGVLIVMLMLEWLRRRRSARAFVPGQT